MEKQRIQKILAQSGIASRRKAEELIKEGLITLNGKIAQLGDKAIFGKDSIKIGGKLLNTKEAPVYLAFYKPRGVISMLSDPHGRTSLKNYLSGIRARVYPIGRLDYNTEGLILLTNDGEMAQEIQTREDILRVYEVKIKGHPEPETLEALKKGSRVEGKMICPESVDYIQKLKSKTLLKITLKGAGATDLKVLLDRKRFLVERIVQTSLKPSMGFGSISLHPLLPGQFRYLKKSQLLALTSVQGKT